MCSTPSGDSMLVITPSSETQNANSVEPEPEVKQFVGASPWVLTRVGPPGLTRLPGAPAAWPTPSRAASAAAATILTTPQRRRIRFALLLLASEPQRFVGFISVRSMPLPAVLRSSRARDRELDQAGEGLVAPVLGDRRAGEAADVEAEDEPLGRGIELVVVQEVGTLAG